jgi:hypothetical protein
MLGKCTGFKALFVMRMDRKFCFVSNAEPAIEHDIQRLNQYQKPIIDNLGENETIVLDKWFTDFVPEQPKGEWLFVSKRPKGRHLSKEENKRNKEINLFPYSIEKELGDLSSRFTTFTVKYQHERKWFTPLLHFDVALHNLIADYFSSPHNFNET